MALILCIPSDVASYLFKDYESSWTVQTFRTDTIFILNIPKENYFEKKMVELWFLLLHIVRLSFIFVPSFMKISMTLLKL